MSRHPIHDLARQDSGLGQLLQQARTFARMNQLFLTLLPTNLHGSCQLVCAREDGLVVFAQSGMAASKLQRFERVILQGFAARGLHFPAVNIVVKPKQRDRTAPKAVPISDQTLAEFEQLSHRIQHPKLRASLEQLTAHHRRAMPPTCAESPATPPWPPAPPPTSPDVFG